MRKSLHPSQKSKLARYCKSLRSNAGYIIMQFLKMWLFCDLSPRGSAESFVTFTLESENCKLFSGQDFFGVLNHEVESPTHFIQMLFLLALQMNKK